MLFWIKHRTYRGLLMTRFFPLSQKHDFKVLMYTLCELILTCSWDRWRKLSVLHQLTEFVVLCNSSSRGHTCYTFYQPVNLIWKKFTFKNFKTWIAACTALGLINYSFVCFFMRLVHQYVSNTCTFNFQTEYYTIILLCLTRHDKFLSDDSGILCAYWLAVLQWNKWIMGIKQKVKHKGTVISNHEHVVSKIIWLK